MKRKRQIDAQTIALYGKRASVSRTKRYEYVIQIKKASCVIVTIQKVTKEMKPQKHDPKTMDLRRLVILHLLILIITIGGSCTPKKWNEMELIQLVVINTS